MRHVFVLTLAFVLCFMAADAFGCSKCGTGCEGEPQWCSGGHCPDDQQATREKPPAEWQLASVTIIRSKTSHQARS